QILDVARVDQTARCGHALRTDPELEIIAVGRALPLLLDRLERPPSLVADHPLPVDLGDKLLELSRRNTRRITAANERAHTPAGNAVHRPVHLFEDFQ